MVNLSISIYQGNEDGTDSFIAVDSLKREDATDKEIKILKALEEYVFDLIKTLPTIKLTDSKIIQAESYKENGKDM